ncbi:Spy/CpxP family protein refolding chaperone [Acetobacter orleanensis]|uniref:Periplasmic heavy metal sensor n=1 Tax=Acetobacter orleanensis TaxID=104099 RepID=A0A4Y3TPK0_9PROT|nr:periplasmic heavy metal sensor [Acetobacter orleanensis]KXV64269.1 hypothetical protein AD949_05980 [Acetobacter orleanensis]PCD79051.1 hypothetical protein CO710_08505 [Acetobacter orleanensis]GAN69429.1 hypothetical protein Abol_034_056 [Acetobacter orleanensis JCM 7639]GBR22519.1 hypothetical protein AA0473_0144 [Acetobacter orleanensis NRIC 0473]GEB82967.1 hypothetical protein AOR01nite_14440 [Acetobacter orleanensis]
MNYRNGFLATAAVIGLSLAALPASAHPGKGEFPPPGGPGGCMMGGGHGHAMSMLEGLDLTKQQRKQVDTILHDARDQDHADDMRGEFSKIHQQIQDILTSPGPVDKDKIAALQQQQATLRAQAEARHLDVASRIHDVLTPDQLAQVKARQTKIHDLMEQLREAEHPAPPPSDK